MSVRTITLFGILAAIIGGVLVAQFRVNDEPEVETKIQQLVQAYDDAVYLGGDYEAAQNAADEIVSLAEKSEDPNATEVRGLIRLVYLEITSGKWGNRWRKKVKRCEELVSQEPTIARAELLLYSGVIKGKYQRKFKEGIERVETALRISDELEDDRTLALAYANLGILSNLAGKRKFATGNTYRAVTIAKHHGQKSILIKTLRNLTNELFYLGNFSEAALFGREILEIEPKALDGLFALFLVGESDQYLKEIESLNERVKKKQKDKSATNKDIAEVGKALKKLAMAYVVQENYSDCRKYTLLAIPYLKIVDDKASLAGCNELLFTTQLDLADTVGEIEGIVEKSNGSGEIYLTALATAYARVGEFEKSLRFRELARRAEIRRYSGEIGFLKQSSDLFWESKVNSRQAKLSNKQAAQSQRRVWLLSTALITGLTACILFGGFYTLLRRERNSLEDLVEKRTRSLSEAMKAASAADHAKSEFLAQINHEIRNPLTAILGYCDLLSLNKGRSLEFVAGIESSSLHLRELVDKILEVSKIESSGLELNCSDFLPAQTTNDINDIALEKAVKKDLRFACSFRGDPKCSIFSDETKIRQIVLNLIVNAIKFTEIGSVTVSLEILKSDASLRIIVKDTGIGIAEAETQTVFDRFAKASNGVACDGSGLGLFITSQLVNCLSGKIALKSELGVGTQVTVDLPITFSCDKSLTPESKIGHVDSDSSLAQAGKRVVLVDDQAVIRSSMELLLNANGIECRTAQNLDETMELIKSWQPDLVLLDLRMPQQSGYEVFESIRDSVHSEVPVYAMTGDATTKTEEKCLKLGFDGFITKPFKIKKIQEILEEQLRAVGPNGN